MIKNKNMIRINKKTYCFKDADISIEEIISLLDIHYNHDKKLTYVGHETIDMEIDDISKLNRLEINVYDWKEVE